MNLCKRCTPRLVYKETRTSLHATLGSILNINEKKKSLVIYKRNGIREKTGSIFPGESKQKKYTISTKYSEIGLKKSES